MAVSPDGGLIALATFWDGLVRLFDPFRAELIDTLRGNLDFFISVAFSPDGKRLIASSRGREAVTLWDLATRQKLLTLSGAGTVWSVQWSGDGDLIVGGVP
jgi:WD40 repeat protein